MNKKIPVTSLLIIVTSLLYLSIINVPLARYDESVILVGAERVLNGQIPHRDFSSEYPLGQYYVLAALFKIFGTSVLTERIYDIAVKTLISVLIFFIIEVLSSRRAALFGWLMSVIWLLYSTFPAYPVYSSMLFIFISLYYLILNSREERPYYVILSGVSVLLAILFRHDLGGYAAIAVILAFIIRGCCGKKSWPELRTFVITAAISGLPVLIYLLINSSVGAFFDDLLFIPMAFLDKQWLPYPGLSRWTLPFFVFPLVVIAGAVSSIIMLKRNRDDSTAYALLLISLVGIICINQARMRSDRVHLIPVALTAILLAPVLIHVLQDSLGLSRLARRLTALFMVAVFAVTLSHPLNMIHILLKRNNWYYIKAADHDFERAKYSRLTPDMQDTVHYIKANTTSDEKIYVGVKNHDQFVFNDVLIYFLAERGYATRYHTLNPGVQTTEQKQREMINEFRDDPPKLIVLATRIRVEPNRSGIDSGVELLDNYIASNYEHKKTFGPFEIWMPKM